MKKAWLLVVFYCIVHASSGDFAVQYEGMDRKTVAELIQKTYNAPFDIVPLQAYQAFLAKNQNGPAARLAPTH